MFSCYRLGCLILFFCESIMFTNVIGKQMDLSNVFGRLLSFDSTEFIDCICRKRRLWSECMAVQVDLSIPCLCILNNFFM